VPRILERASGVTQQRFHGVSLCRALFAATPSDAFTRRNDDVLTTTRLPL
jgi:hypothetical protein